MSGTKFTLLDFTYLFLFESLENHQILIEQVSFALALNRLHNNMYTCYFNGQYYLEIIQNLW